MNNNTNDNTTFSSNVLRLVSGAGIASIISLISLPIIANFFSPASFGMFSIFVSIVALIGCVATLRYEMAIVLPKENKTAFPILILSLLICIVISIVLFLPFTFLKEEIGTFFNSKELIDNLWLVPVGVLLHGFPTALIYWHTRQKRFSFIAVSKVIQQLSYAVIAITFAISGLVSGVYLILSFIISKFLTTLFLTSPLAKYISNEGLSLFDRQRIHTSLLEHRNFPLYGSWSILLGVGAWQLPILMLGYFFSVATVGLYALGFKILQMPMNMIGSAIGQVFYKEAVLAHEDGTLNQLTLDLLKKLIIVGLFPILTLSLIGQDLYKVVFGGEWAEAGLYTQILSLWAFFWFLSGPLTTVFGVLDRQKIQLYWNVANFSTRFLSILIGGYYGNSLLAIILLGISGTFIYALKIYITLKITKASLSEATMVLLKSLALFVPFGILLIFLQMIDISPYILLSISIIVCAIYELYVLKKIAPELSKKLFRI